MASKNGHTIWTLAENVNDEAKTFVSVKIKSRDFDHLLKRSSKRNLVF